MASRIILDLRSLNNVITIGMVNVLGHSARSNNYSELIRLIIDDQLSLYVSDKTEIFDEFASYGVDRENAIRIMSQVTLMVSRSLNGHISNKSNEWYSVSFTNDAILIDKNIVKEDVHIDEYVDETNDISDNYIPERLRKK